MLMAGFGLLSVCNDAAHQSFLPRLLPRSVLPRANARLEQSNAAAQTSGPLLAGGLVTWLGAPAAVLADAVSYLVSGLLIAGTPIDDPAPKRADRSSTSVLTEVDSSLVSMRAATPPTFRARARPARMMTTRMTTGTPLS